MMIFVVSSGGNDFDFGFAASSEYSGTDRFPRFGFLDIVDGNPIPEVISAFYSSRYRMF